MKCGCGVFRGPYKEIPSPEMDSPRKIGLGGVFNRVIWGWGVLKCGCGALRGPDKEILSLGMDSCRKMGPGGVPNREIRGGATGATRQPDLAGISWLVLREEM